MKSITIGTYEPGTFLMRHYLKNFPYELAIQMPFSVGDTDVNNIFSQTPGCEMTTERIMAYIHECNHYIHDMSLSSCVAEDYLRDEISAYVKVVSEFCPTIDYPIFGKEMLEDNKRQIPDIS